VSARLEEHRPPASDGSLVRTFIGSWFREVGGWMASAHVVQLLGDAGLTTSSARTNLSRLKAKGLLTAESVAGVPGYRLAHEAHPMLARGDRRIYGHAQMTTEDPWMVVVFSVPEARRNLRHQLRSHLVWLGCGSVAPGVWIGPGHLVGETREVLAEVGLEPFTTIFCTTKPLVHGDLRDAVRQWWDLDALSDRYRSFIAAHAAAAERAARGDLTDREAFHDHLRALDHWRAIPYLDPGLPREYLPDEWVGERGLALFAELHAALHEPSRRHVLAVAGAAAPAGSR